MPSTLELGCYVLPGKVKSPIPGIAQAKEAERIGLGAIWLSDRWDTKEAVALCGAFTQVTSKIKICIGTTHFVTRHPMVTAGMGATLQALSGGRFVLSFARSSGARWEDMGLPQQTNALMGDYAKILRDLWAGKTVSYDGPAGHYPKLVMADQIDEPPPPIYLAAIGPKACALAGRYFDGVFLHPFVTVEGIAESRRIVRQAAEDAGRDPDSVKIILAIVAAPGIKPGERNFALYGRAATYFAFREMGKLLVEVNGWDMKVIEEINKLGIDRLEKSQASVEEVQRKMIEASALIPDAWIKSGAAVGTPAECAATLMAYRDVGVEEFCIHGTTAEKLEPLAQAYAAL